MPTGIERFQRKQEAKEAARGTGASGMQADYFAILGGTFAVVRILEQGDELVYADVHRVPVANARYPRDLICLDTEDDGTRCPACQSDDDKIRRRSTRGFINVIWRDGPVYERNDFGGPKKDANGKPIIVDREDGVFLWKCSGTVFQMLIEKDSKYKGLMSRDFEVRRTGSTMQDTRYSIDPFDPDGGPQPMTIADQALAAKKYDLQAMTKPLEYAAFVAVMNGAPSSDGPQPTLDRGALATAANVFDPGAKPLQRSSAFTRG